jgi:hypothetical protein
MRVVVDSGVLRDSKEADFDRHLDILSRCVERAQANGAPLQITMILRTADSAPALILMHMTDTLRRVAASAKVILARLEPEEELRRLIAILSELAPSEPAQSLIRWARNPRLLDAHEQATYGTDMCWSGDAMRRDCDRRNVLALFNEGVPDRVRLGRLAFEALWAISSPVPDRHLNGRATAKPAGAFQPAQETPVSGSPVRPSLQPWPLIRH